LAFGLTRDNDGRLASTIVPASLDVLSPSVDASRDALAGRRFFGRYRACSSDQSVTVMAMTSGITITAAVNNHS
jgi:hypothetical protein